MMKLVNWLCCVFYSLLNNQLKHSVLYIPVLFKHVVVHLDTAKKGTIITNKYMGR